MRDALKDVKALPRLNPAAGLVAKPDKTTASKRRRAGDELKTMAGAKLKADWAGRARP